MTNNINSNARKVVLITGAAQRIGAAMSRHLHQAGFNIVVHYRQSASEAQLLVDELNTLRADSAISLACDLNDHDKVIALAQQASDVWGRIDCLINNASSFYPTQLSEDQSQHWDLLFNSNVKGAFFLSQALIPNLQKNAGCIINIIDIHSERPLKNHSIYCMAKAALAMQTKALAKDLGHQNIRVNGISPGAILWPEQEDFTQQQQQDILDRIALQRSGEPLDIAKTALFLAAEAPYITGQIIAIDGGRSLHN